MCPEAVGGWASRDTADATRLRTRVQQELPAPLVLGSLPGRVSVPPRLHPKTRPTYLSRASQRSLRHLPTYLSSSAGHYNSSYVHVMSLRHSFNLIQVVRALFLSRSPQAPEKIDAGPLRSCFARAVIVSPRSALTHFRSLGVVRAHLAASVARTSVRPAVERFDYV